MEDEGTGKENIGAHKKKLYLVTLGIYCLLIIGQLLWLMEVYCSLNTAGGANGPDWENGNGARASCKPKRSLLS